MKIIRQFSIVVLVMVGVLVAVNAFKQSKVSESSPASDRYSHISPITDEWVERDGHKVLRVIYGDTVLEIPEKYNPRGLDNTTKSLSIPLVWPSNSPTRLSEEDKYIYRIFIRPHNQISNYYDDSRKVNNLNKNGYFLRDSVDYPTLKEYWNDEKKKSSYFLVDYSPKVFRSSISCLPGYKESLKIKEKSVLKMGDTSCSIYGLASDTVRVQVRFDARLLPQGNDFHQEMDQLISSFIIQF